MNVSLAKFWDDNIKWAAQIKVHDVFIRDTRTIFGQCFMERFLYYPAYCVEI